MSLPCSAGIVLGIIICICCFIGVVVVPVVVVAAVVVTADLGFSDLYLMSVLPNVLSLIYASSYCFVLRNL